MRRKDLVAFFLLLVFLISSLGACGQDTGNKPADTVQPTSSESTTPLSPEELLEARCTACHDLGRVRSAAQTAEQWEATVQRMVSKGARLTEQEFASLVEYLAENYK